MSNWDDHNLTQRVLSVRADIPADGPPRPMGRPFVTAYQIAIELDRRHPELVGELGTVLGGRGVGQHDSFAQYLGRELSRRFERDELPGVEGAFLSNAHVTELRYEDRNRDAVVSSATGTGYDLSLFRLGDAEG